MQRNIIVKYYPNAQQNKELLTYNYQINLDSDKNFKVDYFTGKQRDIQMNALELALSRALPDTAIINSINNVTYQATKQSLISMLTRKDDYLATILFETKVSEDTDKDSIDMEQKQNVTDSANPTKETCPIEYQPEGKHSYKMMDLTEAEPADTEKIRKIGLSKLSYAFNYQDLKSILHGKYADQLFKNPVGIVPSNGKVTPTRRHTFAANADLDKTALDNASVINVGNVNNSINKKEYTLYLFNINSDNESKESSMNTNSNASLANSKDNTTDTAKQASEIKQTTNSITDTQQTSDQSTTNPFNSIKQDTPLQTSTTKERTDTNGPVTTTSNDAKQDTSTEATTDQQPATNPVAGLADNPFNNVKQNEAKMETTTEVTDNTKNPVAGLADNPFNHVKQNEAKIETTTEATDNTKNPVAGLADNPFNNVKQETAEKQSQVNNNPVDGIQRTNPLNGLPIQSFADNPVKTNTSNVTDKTITTDKKAESTPSISDINTKLDKILQVLTEDHEQIAKKPKTRKELIIQMSGLTKQELYELPKEIVSFCFSENGQGEMQRANSIFKLNEILMNGPIPEQYKCLTDTKLYLKVVHLLSWFN